MTTIELENQAGKQGARKHRFAAVGQALAAVQLWHLRRRTVARIARLDEHLLRDAGFDPDDVRDAINGDDSAL